MSNKLLFIFLIGLFLPIISGQAQYTVDIIDHYIPVHEDLDLMQVGSVDSPYIANLTKEYDIIYAVIFIIHFTSNSFNIEDFGADSSLQNGTLYKYAGNTVHTFQSNDDLNHFADGGKFDEFIDTANPKVQQFKAEAFYPKYLLNTGVYIPQFFVQDDMSALTTVNEFFAQVHGYNIVQEQIYNYQAEKFDPLGVFFNFFWRDNQPTLELFVIFLISAGIVWKFWKRR